MTVTFLRPYGNYSAGQSASLSADTENSLVQQGIAISSNLAVGMNNPFAASEFPSRSIAPSPRNNAVAVLGDSIAYGNGFSSSPTNIKTYAKGYVNWARFLSRQRFSFDNSDNFGIPGDNSSDVLRRTPGALISTSASTIIIDCMTNDEPNGVSFAQSKINYQSIINLVIGAGRIAILIVPRPRDITASGLTMTAAQYRQHLARCDWVRGLSDPARGIHVVDMWRYQADPASSNGAMRSGYSYDGLHPGVTGGYWGGLALAELFGIGRNPGLFKFFDVMVGQNTDIWNADYPRGCVNSNPMLQGGASSATGYTVGGGSGVTVTPTKQSPGNGRTDVQQCVLSGTASANADVYDFYQTISAGNLAAGDVVEAYAELEYDSLSGYTSHGLILVDTTGFTNIAADMVDSTDINAMAFTLPGAITGVMRTPKLTLQNTTLRAGMKGRSINGQAVSGTYRINAMAVRKVM